MCSPLNWLLYNLNAQIESGQKKNKCVAQNKSVCLASQLILAFIRCIIPSCLKRGGGEAGVIYSERDTF